MTTTASELTISLSMENTDLVELDNIVRQLKREIQGLDIESIKNVPEEYMTKGVKGADWASIGQITVTLAPIIIPPLFQLMKSWVERRPSTPVKIRIKVGKRTAQVEYDPTRTTTKELETLVKTLQKSIKN
jgi:hypothetical protein